MLGNLTKFGVIPRGLWNTVSYGTILTYFSTRHVALGIKPGKLGAWVLAREAVVGVATTDIGTFLSARQAVIGVKAEGANASYVCRAAIVITDPSAQPVDEYAANVALFMPLQADFNDHSLTPKTVTAVGSANSIETGTGPFGDNCLVAGSESYLQVLGNLLLGSQDFTLEFWGKAVNGGAYTGVASFCTTIGADFAAWTNAHDSQWASTNGSSWNIMLNAWSPQATYNNTWKHFACERYGGKFKVYVNGVLASTANISSAFAAGRDYCTIGKKGNAVTATTTNRIAHVRCTVGVARYQGEFSKPLKAFPPLS